MIKNIFNLVKCKIKGHEWVQAGSCPFTGKNYKACTKCESMVANEK